MNPLFLQPFLSLLSKEGFCITARDYRRISVALRAEATWTVEGLKAVLLALLVKNPTQEALFVRLFESFFRDVPEDIFLDRRDDLDRAVGELKSVVKEPGKRLIFRKTWLKPDFSSRKKWLKPDFSWRTKRRTPHPQPEEKLPLIKSLSPAAVKVGAKDFTLTIAGGNFTPSAKVFVDGEEVPGRFISPKKILATISSTFTVLAGSPSVVVINEDGERRSKPAFLKVVPKGGSKRGRKVEPREKKAEPWGGGGSDGCTEITLGCGFVLFLAGLLISILTATKEPEKKATVPADPTPSKPTKYAPVPMTIPTPEPTIAPTATPTVVPEVIPEEIPVSHQLFALACLGAFFLYCLYLHSLTKPLEDKPKTWSPTEPGHFRLETIGGEPSARLDRRTLNRLAEALRYQESQDVSETLNIDASVEETGRSGGLPTLVYYRKRKIPTVVIAEDAYAEPTAWNSVARELAEGLRQRGIQTLYGKFLESPLHLYASNRTTYNLARFEEQKDNFLLLFFSDSKSFHEHNADALEVLSRWPGVAWMELRERKFWDEHTWRIAVHNIPVFQATPDDLLRVMPQLSTEPPPQKLRSAADWRGLNLYAGGNLYTYVEYVLGDALLWAQACAMIQPVTLGLADRLRLEFQPDIPAERVGRLFALPNTTYNKTGLSFSTPILSVLRYGFTIRWSEAAQRRILQFILEQIREARPSQTGSLAHLTWQYVYERVRLEVEPDKALRELAALQQTPLRDAIKAEFRRLSLPLSERDRDVSGYRQVPLRRRPVMPDSWQRLAKLTGNANAPEEIPDIFKKSLEYLKGMRHVVRPDEGKGVVQMSQEYLKGMRHFVR